jgi:hypothetical protein
MCSNGGHGYGIGRERGHACMTPQLLSRKRVLTDDFHQPQHLLAEHRTRLVCLGTVPLPRVRCLLA